MEASTSEGPMWCSKKGRVFAKTCVARRKLQPLIDRVESAWQTGKSTRSRSEPTRMNLDGQHYLEMLASLPPETFESRFAKTLAGLSLNGVFDRNEVKLLYEASLKALACNLAINGIGRVLQIRPQDEAKRSRLEREFMLARDLLFASPGWQTLDNKTKQPVEETFLNVFVLADRLAW